MKKKSTRAELIEDAANSLADLYLFGNIVAICESGNVHAPSHKAAERIIDICKAEMDKRLRDYDRLRVQADQ